MQWSSLIYMGRGYERVLDSTRTLLVSGAPELPSHRQMSTSARSCFVLHDKVFWLAGTRDVPHSPACPITMVSVQRADGCYGSCSDVGETLWYLR